LILIRVHYHKREVTVDLVDYDGILLRC
jgi:hypothetical protein